MSSLFSFPNPVNEYAARGTAALVVGSAVVAVIIDHPVVYALLFIGFLLRVAGGPRFSPLGRLSVHVLVPHVIKRTKLVPGPPKRFAQAIGAVVSGAALLLSVTVGGPAAQIAVSVLIIAALLESVFGFCLGCAIFARLQRIGVIPESVCRACADISTRGASV